MNIFVLDEDPQLAATYMYDKHVVKMVLESAQLLSTAHRVLDGDPLPDDREQVMYKATHVNHPCAVWCRTSVQNYTWLVDHFESLLAEYTHRYDKRHKCHAMLFQLQSPPFNLRDYEMTPFAQAMPEDFKSEDAVASYRTYYEVAKIHLFGYKRRKTPEWFNTSVLDNWE